MLSADCSGAWDDAHDADDAGPSVCIASLALLYTSTSHPGIPLRTAHTPNPLFRAAAACSRVAHAPAAVSSGAPRTIILSVDARAGHTPSSLSPRGTQQPCAVWCAKGGGPLACVMGLERALVYGLCWCGRSGSGSGRGVGGVWTSPGSYPSALPHIPYPPIDVGEQTPIPSTSPGKKQSHGPASIVRSSEHGGSPADGGSNGRLQLELAEGSLR